MFGELEKRIMEVLWHKEKGTVRDVLSGLRSRFRKDLAYTTVMTVLTRLAEKGHLKREAQENGSFLYVPRYSKENFYAKTQKAFFSQMLRTHGSLAIAQFVDALEEVRPDQLDELKKILKKRSS